MAQENIKKVLKDYKEETKRHFDEKTDETKRHFDVVAEDLKGNIEQVAEGVSLNSEKIDTLTKQVALNTEKLTEHDVRFNKIDDTLETIKLDLEFIKNELKQKVNRDEFAVLEKRVSMLEAKLNQRK